MTTNLNAVIVVASLLVALLLGVIVAQATGLAWLGFLILIALPAAALFYTAKKQQ